MSKACKVVSFVILCLYSLFFIFSCKKSATVEEAWSVYFPRLGTGSSPKCADLNRDGVLDIILGAGENENEPSDSAVLALDGRDGKILWRASAENQIVGSPVLLDITNDPIPEVIIGGRGAQLLCINGSTGDVLWRFQKTETSPVMKCCFRFNFFNAQIIPDADADHIPDLLVTNGGNADAKPHSTDLRAAGVLAIMSSRTGNIIVADTMPDGSETYMTPVIHDFENNGKPAVIIGTGGETLGGRLYKIPFDQLVAGNISQAKVLVSREKYGFMGPPVLADINEDNIKDIVVNWFGGSMLAFDGKTDSLLWECVVPKTESYSTPVPGYFTDDRIPDFFSLFNKGAWPDNKGSVQVLVDGKNGTLLFRDTTGCMGYSSPISIDLNGDGSDEAVYSVNEYLCDPPAIMGEDIVNSKHSLLVYDHPHRSRYPLTVKIPGKNISTTPWAGDLDGDGYLDLIYSVQRNQFKVADYDGLNIIRVKTNIKAGKISWSSYLGERSDCVF